MQRCYCAEACYQEASSHEKNWKTSKQREPQEQRLSQNKGKRSERCKDDPYG